MEKPASVVAPSGTEYVMEERIRSTGEKIMRKYLKGKLLGKGGFAKCYEFTDTASNVMTAGKVVEKAGLKKPRAKQKVGYVNNVTMSLFLNIGQLIAEIKIHRALQHKYVVKFEHYFEDKDNVYILLELCANRVRALCAASTRAVVSQCLL